MAGTPNVEKLNDSVHPPAAPTPALSPKVIPNDGDRLGKDATKCEDKAFVLAHTTAILKDVGQLSLSTQWEVQIHPSI